MSNYILTPYDQALKDFTEGDKDAIIKVHSNLTENEEIAVAYLFRTEGKMPVMEQEALNLCQGKILDVGAGGGCHATVLKIRDSK